MPMIAELERLELEARVVDHTFREKGPSPLLQGAILICKELPAHAKKAQEELWRLLKAKQVDDLQEGGQRFLDTLNQALVAVALYAYNTAMPLEDVQVNLEQIRKEHQEKWPFFRQEDLEQARIEAAHGETIDLDDAFAAIAGVTKEDWNSRVEAYERQKESKEGS